MIRVLLVIPTLDASGAEKQFAMLAAGLPRDRFEPHAVALTRSGPYAAALRRAGVPLTVLGKRFKADPVALARLRRFVRRLRPDVLHTWLFAANAYGRLAAGRRGGPRVVVSERCVDRWKSGWQLWLDRKLVGRTDLLVGNSESVARFYRDLGVPSEKVRVIPNAVERADDAGAEERVAFRRSLGLPDDAKIVGYVGRLAKQKRVDVLVWATQLLRQLTRDVYHVVVGDGPQRPYLEDLARHFTCDDVTRFVGHRDDARRLLPCFDLCWLASDFEGQSNSLLEAMSAGLPVIASDIPANRELVEDGVTGYLVRPGDSVAFAQYADRLLADRGLARRLGETARVRAAERHSPAAMIAAYVAVYKELTGGNSGPGTACVAALERG